MTLREEPMSTREPNWRMTCLVGLASLLWASKVSADLRIRVYNPNTRQYETRVYDDRGSVIAPSSGRPAAPAKALSEELWDEKARLQREQDAYNRRVANLEEARRKLAREAKRVRSFVDELNQRREAAAVGRRLGESLGGMWEGTIRMETQNADFSRRVRQLVNEYRRIQSILDNEERELRSVSRDLKERIAAYNEALEAYKKRQNQPSKP